MPVITQVSIIEVGSKLGITKVDYNTAEISRTRSDSLPAVSAISLLRFRLMLEKLAYGANASESIAMKDFQLANWILH